MTHCRVPELERLPEQVSSENKERNEDKHGGRQADVFSPHLGEQRASVWPTGPAATALFWPLWLRGLGPGSVSQPCVASSPTTVTGPSSPLCAATDRHGYRTSLAVSM